MKILKGKKKGEEEIIPKKKLGTKLKEIGKKNNIRESGDVTSGRS